MLDIRDFLRQVCCRLAIHYLVSDRQETVSGKQLWLCMQPEQGLDKHLELGTMAWRRKAWRKLELLLR